MSRRDRVLQKFETGTAGLREPCWDAGRMAEEIIRLEVKFKAAEEIEKAETLLRMDTERERDEAKEFGEIQGKARQAAERRINELEEEAGRFYAADGSFERGLSPQMVIEKRIAAASELEAAKDEIKRLQESEYAWQTAPLTSEEMTPILRALADMDGHPPDSRERDAAVGTMERALEGLCQGRALILARVKMMSGVVAEEAIECMMPISTKLRQLTTLDQSEIMTAALDRILEANRKNIRRMQVTKMIADAAPGIPKPPLGLEEAVEIALRRLIDEVDGDSGTLRVANIMEIRDDLEAALPEKGGADAAS